MLIEFFFFKLNALNELNQTNKTELVKILQNKQNEESLITFSNSLRFLASISFDELKSNTFSKQRIIQSMQKMQSLFTQSKKMFSEKIEEMSNRLKSIEIFSFKHLQFKSKEIQQLSNVFTTTKNYLPSYWAVRSFPLQISNQRQFSFTIKAGTAMFGLCNLSQIAAKGFCHSSEKELQKLHVYAISAEGYSYVCNNTRTKNQNKINPNERIFLLINPIDKTIVFKKESSVIFRTKYDDSIPLHLFLALDGNSSAQYLGQSSKW